MLFDATEDRAMTKLIRVVSSVALAITLGCSKKVNDSVAEAQDCLNTARGESALACMNAVQGITTPAAEMIRCASYLQWQGIGAPATLASAIDQLTGPNAGNTSALLGLVAFTQGSQPFTDSGTMFDHCYNSNSRGLLFLGAFTRIATAGVYAEANCGGNNAAYSAACSADTTCIRMACAIFNTQTIDAMGQVLIATEEKACRGSTQSICADINAAVQNAPVPGNRASVFCSYVVRVAGISYASLQALPGTNCP